MIKEEVNKSLIIFSAVGVTILLVLNDLGKDVQLGTAGAITTGILFLAIFPLLVLWFKALWNEIAHKVFNLPLLGAWQAAGLLILLGFIFGIS